jgi:hypothetical protein
MKYFYPDDLVTITIKRWNHLQEILFQPAKHQSSKTRKAGEDNSVYSTPKRPPFPDEESLKAILDILYHVSFLTEESRRIAARVTYILPSTSEQKLVFLHKPPIAFLSPMSFTVSNVLRLAPAIEPTQSLIAVCPCKLVNLKASESPLAIWGILHLGTEWWRALTGKESAALAPPNCLTVSTFAPGSITATSGGMVLFRLQAGQLLGLPLEDLSDGHIGFFLQEAAESLYQKVCKELGRKKYDRRKDSDDHPRQQYFRTLANIINLARERYHGGTFIILPDEIGLEDHRLRDRLSIKYTLKSPNIWAKLINEAVANRKYFDLLFPKKNTVLTSMDDASAKDLKSLICWETERELAQKDIAEFENFVSSLSGVDGAVVLTKKLKVLGFGAEIIASSPSLTTVMIAADPKGKKYTERPISSFGTRHRSALRLCSSFEQSVCFVISQDGAVRAIKRVGPDLYMWNDVNLGRFGL